MTNRVTRWLSCLAVMVVVSATTTSIAVGAVVGPVTSMSVTPGDKQMTISWTAPVVGALAAVPLCRVLSLGAEEPCCAPVDEPADE